MNGNPALMVLVDKMLEEDPLMSAERMFRNPDWKDHVDLDVLVDFWTASRVMHCQAGQFIIEFRVIPCT